MKLVNPGWVVIHTAGTPERAIDISAAAIREYHIHEKGWADIGYHYVVRFDGTIEAGRDEDVMGAHVEGFNSKSLGVCFSGNGDLADFTEHQKDAGARLVAELLRRHGIGMCFVKNPMRVLGHRETPHLVDAGVFPGPKTTKTCPGRLVDMQAFRQRVAIVLRGAG